MEDINPFLTGSIQAVEVKFKDFSRTSKSLSNNFQGPKVNKKNTDLSVKIHLQKYQTEIMETLVLEY